MVGALNGDIPPPRSATIVPWTMSTAGEARDHVEIIDHEDFLEVRILGSFLIDRFKRQFDAAVRACRERKRSKLLVDSTRIEGPISTVDRYHMGNYGAQEGVDLQVASLTRPDLVDPGKFGVVVAKNRGLTIDVFTDRQKAVDWLQSLDTDASSSGRDVPHP